MIKTILKHHVYDLFLNTLFDGFIDTFSSNEPESNVPVVGKYYSKIEHIEGYEIFYNCIVKSIESVIDDKFFVKISYEYVKDYSDIDGEDQMTSDEFADVYGDDPEDEDDDADDIETVVMDEGIDSIDLILNEDKTVSVNSAFYIFHQ